jgi:hypothetical protein
MFKGITQGEIAQNMLKLMSMGVKHFRPVRLDFIQDFLNSEL